MELLLLQLHNPGESPVLAGFFLYTPAHEDLQFRIRRNWPEILDPFHREYLKSLDETFQNLQNERGNADLIKYLEETLSNVLRLSSRLTFYHEAATIAELADSLAKDLLSPPPGSSG